MSQTPVPQPETTFPISAGQAASAEHWMAELGSLLHELETVAGATPAVPTFFGPQTDNQLVQVRLGIASSLFASLQCKHPPTAGHCLRVALTCSAWATYLGLDEQQRDGLEVAALLHDVGMIGVPDIILGKPMPLSADEAAVVAKSRHMSLEILRHSCSSPEILEMVGQTAAWYDGSHDRDAASGEDIPLGARMIAIVEAFDAMTTDHVYRPAMPHERAMSELFDCAGTQFDPELVRQFAEFRAADQCAVHEAVAWRWLRSLDPELVNSYWELNCVPSSTPKPDSDTLFQVKLLDNMYDAVVFIDADGLVTLWNRGAERLTGIPGASVRQRRWHPELLQLMDEKRQAVSEFDCPVTCAIRSGVQSLRRLTISGRNKRPIAVDSHTIPVMSQDGKTLGAILLFHDASSETTLERRCQSLHEKATKDPLTQVANRAEFDRVHEMFIAAHQQQGVPCSLMIMDLDRFKRVNDTFGHQAGDQAIMSLARLLKGACRPGDLAARYGGEEFVMLCADCDNPTAVRRAEQIRKALSQMAQPAMEGRALTASFGVTEIQPGDTPETMLRRADRALLMAKSQGRNQVVQLGTGGDADRRDGQGPLGISAPDNAYLIERQLVTPVPIKMAVEKLRGFVADHQARIIKTETDRVELEIDDKHPSRFRRLTDRPVTFRIDLRFLEQRSQQGGDTGPRGGVARTKVYVSIGPSRPRDRRRQDVAERARDVLASFRSYLMATEVEEEPLPRTDGPLSRAKRLFAPWLHKRP
ncbi:MAG: diguanylate cyclase [Patescibacteria group bacterium]|nr:diguanylate cyclase [Patescibacteria group bacterium]